jgi:peptidoglycan/xylan/chitin deacetylase (PgdA/CDA1 family)
VNIEILDVEVSSMYGLDHRAIRMLADERMDLLQREMRRAQQASRRATRERVGLWLVGFGFRLAGRCSPPPRQAPSA